MLLILLHISWFNCFGFWTIAWAETFELSNYEQNKKEMLEYSQKLLADNKQKFKKLQIIVSYKKPKNSKMILEIQLLRGFYQKEKLSKVKIT